MKKLVLLAALAMAKPAFALDDCLIGAWVVDSEDMAQALATQLNGTAEFVDGEAFMDIAPDGVVRMLASNIVMKVRMQGSPEFEVTVTGTSGGMITADDGAWVLTGGEYTLVGSAFVLGQSISIPFSSDTGMFGGGRGSFTCGAGILAFETDDDTARMPSNWFRVAE